MNSPPEGGAERKPIATIDKQHTSNRRFIVSGEEDYLCRPRNSASGRGAIGERAGRMWSRRPRVITASKRPKGGPSPFDFYQPASTSPRTRSFHVWRFRISANL